MSNGLLRVVDEAEHGITQLRQELQTVSTQRYDTGEYQHSRTSSPQLGFQSLDIEIVLHGLGEPTRLRWAVRPCELFLMSS